MTQKTLDYIMTHASLNSCIIGRHPTCTLWYDCTTGDVLGIGDGNPAWGNTNVLSATLLCDKKYRPLPTLDSKQKLADLDSLPSLLIALERIQNYRTENWD